MFLQGNLSATGRHYFLQKSDGVNSGHTKLYSLFLSGVYHSRRMETATLFVTKGVHCVLRLACLDP